MENLPQKATENKPALIQVSDALFRSGLFPNVKNAFGAFSIVQYGHELGIGPMTSLQSMAIIQGKICMAGQMMLSLAIKNGVTYKITKDTNTECEIVFKKDALEYTSSFSIAEAKQAGIWRAQSGWEKFPRDMLFWRTVTRGLRRVAPDVILGLYAIEEIKDAPPINGTMEVEVEKEQPQEQPPVKTANFFWLNSMKKAKAKLGEAAYYEILTGRWNYEHANLVTSEEEQKTILQEMRDAYKEKTA